MKHPSQWTPQDIDNALKRVSDEMSQTLGQPESLVVYQTDIVKKALAKRDRPRAAVKRKIREGELREYRDIRNMTGMSFKERVLHRLVLFGLRPISLHDAIEEYGLFTKAEVERALEVTDLEKFRKPPVYIHSTYAKEKNGLGRVLVEITEEDLLVMMKDNPGLATRFKKPTDRMQVAYTMHEL